MQKSPNAKKSNYRPPIYYNLEAIISVGYHVKSQRGILFRRWTNKVLKDHLIKGLKHETIWLTQEKMSSLFDVDRTRIVRHIANIYKEGELERSSTCAESAHMGSLGVQQDFFFGGARQKYFCRKIRRMGKCLMGKNIVWHNIVSLVKCNLKRGWVHIIFIIA